MGISSVKRGVTLAIALLLGVPSALTWSAPAHADPCKGRLPAAGKTFAGVVRYVGDGDGLCIGPAGRPEKWIEVRLGDFYAPELHEPGGRDAKRRLATIAMNRPLACHAGRRSYDRVIGFCTLAGRPLGSLLRAAGGKQGGRGMARRTSRAEVRH